MPRFITIDGVRSEVRDTFGDAMTRAAAPASPATESTDNERQAEPQAEPRLESAEESSDLLRRFAWLSKLDASRMSVPQFCARSLEFLGLDVPRNDRDCFVRALDTVGGFNALAGQFTHPVLPGFESVNDTTRGWLFETSFDNFRSLPVPYIDSGSRLLQVGRGQAALATSYSYETSMRAALARFGASVELDEHALLDGSAIGVVQAAMRLLGVAAGNVRPDLTYSLLLRNPTLGDGVTLFHASRGNVGSAAVGAGGIDEAAAAIGGQTLTDELGQPLHVNMRPRYQIVHPDDAPAAQRAARDILASEGLDLIVRGESRLSSTGLIDPLTGNLIQPPAEGGWLMACEGTAAPGLGIAYRNGKSTPTVRTNDLGPGRWGVRVDVMVDLVVFALSGKPLFWSGG